ncbi:membrane protease YdiL (CAAX protease family) [Stackebrandtia albiflava]|uniref:Membrane protease YdiL (CAAX protease family) n=1 Tax=Stackebrandtia albiflava TaxID=406432 RepID=A0A562UQQ3_9ACTN|nr:type II CAAX endopeptidase family protein [Stackebrandtia albiflava]TWJ07941.1 membrane protease YdiL (CAAX protease family) [Stackebrandtia albiflava]
MSEIEESKPPRFHPLVRILLTMAGMFGFVAAGIAVSLIVMPFGLHSEVAGLFSVAGMAAGAIGVAALLRRFVDRRPVRPVRRSSPWSASGALLTGVVLAAAVMGLVKVVRVLFLGDTWQAFPMSGWVLAGLLALRGLVILLGQAFPEELLFRGYLFSSLSRQWPRWAVVTAVSVSFGVLHVISNPGADADLGFRLLYAVMATGLGLAVAACRAYGGTIWLAVGFHTGHNLTAGALGTSAYDWSLLLSGAALAGFGTVLLLLDRRRSRRAGNAVPTATAVAAGPAA